LKHFFFSLHSSSNHVFLGNVFLFLHFFLALACSASWSRRVNLCAHSFAGETDNSVWRDAILLQKSRFENISANLSYGVCSTCTGDSVSSSICEHTPSWCVSILSNTSCSKFFESIFILLMRKKDPGFC